MSTSKSRTRAPAPAPPRSGLVPAFPEFAKRNTHIFRTPVSLRWHLRNHREAYIEAGALLEIAGKLFIDPVKFEPVMREIGQRNAAAAGRSR